MVFLILIHNGITTYWTQTLKTEMMFLILIRDGITTYGVLVV